MFQKLGLGDLDVPFAEVICNHEILNVQWPHACANQSPMSAQ